MLFDPLHDIAGCLLNTEFKGVEYVYALRNSNVA